MQRWHFTVFLVAKIASISIATSSFMQNYVSHKFVFLSFVFQEGLAKPCLCCVKESYMNKGMKLWKIVLRLFLSVLGSNCFICLLIWLFFKDREMETLIHLLGSYVGEVLQRCRQFRDQLLASCLTLIFRLPLCIVTDIFPKLISPLQVDHIFHL